MLVYSDKFISKPGINFSILPKTINDSMPLTCLPCAFCGTASMMDAVKEGDGDRIVIYWKLLLPIFQQQDHYNYAKVAFLILAQILYLSERKITELKWNRTVNICGRTGCNILCDLHMEHLNMNLKTMLCNIGP